MAGTANTEKKTDKKKQLKIVLTVLAAAALVFIVKSLFNENKEGEERRKQQNIQESIDRGVTDEKSKYAEPIATTADTDDTRRYGYDVLYAHHGVKILLTESKIYIDEPEITLNISNESNEKFTVEIQYCVVNGLTYHPVLNCEVPPGESVDSKFLLDSSKMKEIKLSKLRLCFTVYNEDFSIYENSAAILIDYDRLPLDSWNASENSVQVYEDELHRINAGPCETTDTASGFKNSLSLITKNDDPNDLEIYMTGCRLFDKNSNEISEEDYSAVFYSILPGSSLSSSKLTVKIKNSSVKPEELGELFLAAAIVPRGAKDLDGAEKIIFTVPFNQ